MGKDWDKDKGGPDRWIAWLTEIMSECLRVAKPGAMLLCWSIPRTSHWTGTAIEQAGWEVRDVITHLFGSGFPKSHNISKAIDERAGAEREVIGSYKAYGTARTLTGGNYGGGGKNINERDEIYQTAPATDDAKEWDGWGTSLKPAAEFWWLAMKPLDGTFAENAMQHGCAGLNIDGSRIGFANDQDGQWHSTTGPGSNGIHKGANGWHFGGNSEPKDRIRYDSKGRWPANLILDEEAAAALDEQSGETGGGSVVRNNKKNPYGSERTWNVSDTPAQQTVGYNDTGGASRFFYTAKASRRERDAGLDDMPEQDSMKWSGGSEKMNGIAGHYPDGTPRPAQYARNNHPTVKSLALMRYLVRLTKTPRGGIVLDPFMGSGSTGAACMLERRQFVGIDHFPEYVEIARRRIEHWRNKVSAEQPRLWEDIPLFTT